MVKSNNRLRYCVHGKRLASRNVYTHTHTETRKYLEHCVCFCVSFDIGYSQQKRIKADYLEEEEKKRLIAVYRKRIVDCWVTRSFPLYVDSVWALFSWMLDGSLLSKFGLENDRL